MERTDSAHAGHIAHSVVAQQVVQAGAPREALVVRAERHRLVRRRGKARVKADIRHEDVQIRVAVVVAYRKAHPRADLIHAHDARHIREAHIAGRRVVTQHVQPVAVVRHPQVGIAVAVVVEEGYRLRLPARIAHATAEVVAQIGVVAFVLVAGFGILVQHRLAIALAHPDLLPVRARTLADVCECQVAVVAIQHIVLPVLERHAHATELVFREIADIDVHPAVDIDIGASRAHRRARVGGIAERRFRDVVEGAVAHIQQQAVDILPAFRLRAIVQSVRQAALRADI